MAENRHTPNSPITAPLKGGAVNRGRSWGSVAVFRLVREGEYEERFASKGYGVLRGV